MNNNQNTNNKSKVNVTIKKGFGVQPIHEKPASGTGSNNKDNGKKK